MVHAIRMDAAVHRSEKTTTILIIDSCTKSEGGIHTILEIFSNLDVAEYLMVFTPI